MLDDKELFEIENFFSYLNLLLSGTIIIYFLMFSLFKRTQDAPDLYIFAASITVLGIDFGLGKIDYLKSEFLLKSIKFIELLIFAVFAVWSNSYAINVIIAGVIYILISVQLMVTFDITEFYSKVLIVLFNTMPLALVLITSCIINGAENFYIFLYISFIIVISLCQISVVNVLSAVCDKLYEKIFTLNNQLSTNVAENDSMKSFQDKMIHINEQLSMQRFKLENANKIISRNANETQLINTINNVIASTLDIDELIKNISKNIVKYLNSDFTYIAVIPKTKPVDMYDDELESWFGYKYSENINLSDVNKQLLDANHIDDEYLDKSFFVIENEFADIKYDFLRNSMIKSIAIYSTDINNDYKSIFMLCKKEVNSFLDDEDFIKNMFNQVNLAFNNALLYSKMHSMAIKDALTKIYNRQYFNTMQNEYMRKCVDDNKILTIVMFDIDKFKRINDTYGHIFGDEVIRFCGYSAKKFTKLQDSFAVRYGGEEFVLIFPNVDAKTVLGVCTEMHEFIKAKEFDYNGEVVHINVSMGIASYPDNTKDPSTLLSLADKALYFSKENGRGRITVYIDELDNGV